MHDVEWTTSALNDLRRIDLWLEQEDRPDHADQLLTAIRARTDWLSDFPRGGRPFRRGTRILRVFDTPYLIRYRILEDTNTVQILRVHHERQDWSAEP